MDILAARKKAAELAKTGRATEKTPAMPADREPAKPVDEVHPEIPVTGRVETVPERVESPVPPAPRQEEQAPEVAAESSGEIAVEAAEEQQEQELEMLAFLLGTEEYVLPVEVVGEVLTPREITPVPHVPSYILGVCSLRGTVLPIIDLNRRLGLAESIRDERSRIIVVALGADDRIGLFVDRVRGVVKILPSSVRPAPETVEQTEGAAFLRGIARKDDRLYIILDVQKTAAVEQGDRTGK